MKPYSRKNGGRELTVRKFRDNDQNNRSKRLAWTREGSLRELNQAVSAEREQEEV